MSHAKENVYFEAAKAIGAPLSHILIRHVLPNIMPVMIIIFSLDPRLRGGVGSYRKVKTKKSRMKSETEALTLDS